MRSLAANVFLSLSYCLPFEQHFMFVNSESDCYFYTPIFESVVPQKSLFVIASDHRGGASPRSTRLEARHSISWHSSSRYIAPSRSVHFRYASTSHSLLTAPVFDRYFSGRTPPPWVPNSALLPLGNVNVMPSFRLLSSHTLNTLIREPYDRSRNVCTAAPPSDEPCVL